MNGWIWVNKRSGISSMDEIRELRRRFGDKKLKAGHAGTLDPFATGVLPVAIGEATKLLRLFENMDKEYVFEMTFGSQTDTGDLTGSIVQQNISRPVRVELEQALTQFIGEIDQVPHKVSAIKINGERAYDLFRKGQDVQLTARKISIYELELLDFQQNTASLRVRCSKGTYVRSLCEDIAAYLNILAHVSKLERTKYGQITCSMTSDALLPIKTIHNWFEMIEITQDQVKLLKYGLTIEIQHENKQCVMAVCNRDIIGLVSIDSNIMSVCRLLNYTDICSNC